MKFVYGQPPSSLHTTSLQLKCQGHPRKIGRKCVQMRKILSGTKRIVEHIKSLDWLRPLNKERAYRVQKCVVDWKIENLDFLKTALLVENNGQCPNPGHVMSFCTETFTVGKELGRESTWYLNFRWESSRKGQGKNHVSVLLFLKGHRGTPCKSITVSFLIHAVDVDEEIFLSKHLTDVQFTIKPRNGSIQDPHHKDQGHGFFDLLSHSDLISPINNLISPLNSSLHLRLELYLTSDKPFLVPFEPLLNLVESHNYPNCLRIMKTETGLLHPTPDSLEILSQTRSLHVHPKYLTGIPKLRELLQEEKEDGSLGLLHLEEFSDKAVVALLSFLVGNYTKFHGDLKTVLKILQVGQFCNIPRLLHDTWVNALVILSLETLPQLAVLAFHSPPPNFVVNYIHILILNYISELRQTPQLYYWVTQSPHAFSAIFLQAEKDWAEQDQSNSGQLKGEFYSLEHFRLTTMDENHSTNLHVQEVAVGDGMGVRNDGESSEYILSEDCNEDKDEDDHEDHCPCSDCRRIQIFSRERLAIHYEAKVTNWNDSCSK